jgi:hypothetical protein
MRVRANAEKREIDEEEKRERQSETEKKEKIEEVMREIRKREGARCEH